MTWQIYFSRAVIAVVADGYYVASRGRRVVVVLVMLGISDLRLGRVVEVVGVKKVERSDLFRFSTRSHDFGL